MTRSIPLTDLDAEIKTTRWGQADDAPRCTTLLFRCPLCEDTPEEPYASHYHVVPYRPGQPHHGKEPVIGNVWGHAGGATLEDLTLTPSYLAESSRCRLHVFVRGGQLQVLGDSRRKR